MSYLEQRIDGIVEAEDLHVGHGVTVEAGAIVRGRRVVLGDFAFVGQGTKIFVDHFELGEYTKFHNYGFAHGGEPMSIGACCWIGGHVVLDSLGGLTIGNGVGIGAGSQLWTHIQHGDIVQGCRFHSRRAMNVGDDAWFVGHCLVSPITVGARAMALLGSVVTRSMMADHVYAGAPAVDVTDKVGPQFETLPRASKRRRFESMLDAFHRRHPEFRSWVPDCDLDRRTYRKTLSEAEVTFMRENVPLVKLYAE